MPHSPWPPTRSRQPTPWSPSAWPRRIASAICCCATWGSSALTVPLSAVGLPLGVIGVYWKTLQEMDIEGVTFAETIAHMLGTSLARANAENELECQRLLHEMVLTAIDSIVMVVDLEGRLVSINGAGVRLCGFSGPEVQGRPFQTRFIVPEEQEAFTTAFSQVSQSRQPVNLTSWLLTKNNKRPRVHWSLRTGGSLRAGLRRVAGGQRSSRCALRRHATLAAHGPDRQSQRP